MPHSRHVSAAALILLAGVLAIVTVRPALSFQKTVTIICEKCGKEVSLSSAYGQKCPYCGALWVFADEAPAPATMSHSESGVTATEVVRDDRPQAFQPAPAGAPQAGARQQVDPPASAPATQMTVPPPPPMNQGVREEMSLATVPGWMKAVLALGSVGLIYYLLFYRR